MRKVNFVQSLSIKVSENQRRTLERIAQKKDCTLGEASRFVIDAGLKALAVSQRI